MNLSLPKNVRQDLRKNVFDLVRLNIVLWPLYCIWMFSCFYCLEVHSRESVGSSQSQYDITKHCAGMLSEILTLKILLSRR